ncbi:MAG: type II secretion system F family protein [Syntrophaceae bacterium]|nr:type II secretion system F family protein [Syntrophaceae bacterium]
MPTFNYKYKAINQMGEEISGKLEAESMENANAILVSRQLIPIQVREKSTFEINAVFQSLSGINKVKPSDLILFTKQFHSMLVAGIPILRILSIQESQTENKSIKEATAKISRDINKGASLSDALRKFPKIFDNLYCDMIKAGEISGNVPIVMERLIYIIEHEAKIRSDIKSALRYPIIVLIALAGAFIGLLTFVIPTFANVFVRAGIQLPLPTRISMIVYDFLSNYWYFILAIMVGIVFGLLYYFKTSNGKFVRDSFLLEVPILGPLFQKSALSRFASIFSILQTSGVPVMQSLSILSATMGNEALTRAFDDVRERIKEGAGIATPLKSIKYFTPMVIDMLAVGEESGKIDEMMRAVSVHYDSEVEYAIKGLSDALTPILIVGLAAIVGFFALAIFMPMWDLTKMIKT